MPKCIGDDALMHRGRAPGTLAEVVGLHVSTADRGTTLWRKRMTWSSCVPAAQGSRPPPRRRRQECGHCAGARPAHRRIDRDVGGVSTPPARRCSGSADQRLLGGDGTLLPHLNQYRVNRPWCASCASRPHRPWNGCSRSRPVSDEGLYESGVDGVPRDTGRRTAAPRLPRRCGARPNGARHDLALLAGDRAAARCHGRARHRRPRQPRRPDAGPGARRRADHGGFGQDPELVRRFYPSAAQWGPRTWAISCPGADGSGIKLGVEVGADLAVTTAACCCSHRLSRRNSRSTRRTG